MNDLIKENETLNQKNIDLINKHRELEKEFTLLKEDNTKLKIANSISGPSENNRETKLKINEMVREIDNCIKLLTKQ
jgi:hypothetical protein